MKNLLKTFIIGCLILPLVFVAAAKENISEQKKEVREVEVFSALSMNGVCDVYLSQGDKQSVIVETDLDKIENVTTKVKNGMLVIDLKDSKSFKRAKIDVYVTMKDVNSISQNGVGDLESVTELNLKSLKVANTGVGNIKLKGKVETLNMTNSGVGDIEAAELEAKKVYLNNSGVGGVRLKATEEVEVYNSGVGTVKYYGNPKIKNIHSTGVGSVKNK